MFKNYIKTAFRNFWRNKTFSVINVLGLSIGISASLIIFLIVFYEFSYDKFEKDSNRIYRVVIDAKFDGNEGHSAAVQAPLAGAMQNEVTGVELTVPIMQFQGDATAKVTIAKEGMSEPLVFKKQADILFTNPQYFYLLPYKWVAGTPNTSLKNPFNVVLTESRAHRYFPSLPATDIIGKQINYNDDITVTVSGIVKDLNKETAFTGVEFISYATIAQTHLQDQFMMNVWNDWMAYSQLYVKLSAGSKAPQIETQLKTLLAKYNKNANKDAANTMSFRLQPLNDVHFNNQYASVGGRTAHLPTLYGLLAIAAFLLLLGCINFINLTTANATQRAKEIGIRKTMGSSKKQLVFQFLGETFFITSIATIISVCLTPLLFDVFKDFIPPGLNVNILQQPSIFLFLFLLTLFVSFISGLYPALILSGYKPALVLKNQSFANSGETRHAWVRKALTVSQFVIAQFFIIATLMVSKQINYSLNTDLGFNKDGIITFDAPRDTVTAHTQQLLNSINAIPEVQVASSGFLSPADVGVAFTNVSYPPKKDVQVQVQIRWGNPAYIDVYKLKLLAGRNVAASDTFKEFLINDAYAKLLGFQKPNDALGKYLSFNGKQMPVVGVMQDFHDQSTHAPIFPLVFIDGNGSTFHVRLKPNSAGGFAWHNAINKMQKIYKQLYPDEDFNYKFYDDTIAKMYEQEQQTASLLSWATGLAIFISCLGLLGLVMYTINTRRKEIGIRKILGASVTNIVSVLSTDFIKLVCLAFLIAAPLAWWAIYKWLEDYAYKTALSWWVFLLAGLGMLLIALITLSIQTIKAAIANPVKSLRTE
ncbi:MAG: ABC transporter permease [Bacteroidota bacterium]|nr:ABC transporter permease [Bacteroidota bacterium]